MAMSEDWWSHMMQNDVGTATRIVQSLQELGVKVMAFDFDRTMIDLNTGGKWKKSVDQLASHMRPCMKDLIGAAIANPKIFVSIVTFSIQPQLIYDMLKAVYPNKDTSEIIIAANPNKIKPQLTPAIYNIGKQKHIQDVCQLLESKQGQKITPEQIILFDDRKRYCKIAEENGHLAFAVEPDVDINKIKNYVDLQITKRLSSMPTNVQFQPTAQQYIQPHQPVTMVAVLPTWPQRHDHSAAEAIFEKSAANRDLAAFPQTYDHSAAEQIFQRGATNREMYNNPYNIPLPNIQQILPTGYGTSQAIISTNQMH